MPDILVCLTKWAHGHTADSIASVAAMLAALGNQLGHAHENALENSRRQNYKLQQKIRGFLSIRYF